MESSGAWFPLPLQQPGKELAWQARVSSTQKQAEPADEIQRCSFSNKPLWGLRKLLFYHVGVAMSCSYNYACITGVGSSMSLFHGVHSALPGLRTALYEGITCVLMVHCLIVCSYIFTQISTSEMCFSVPLCDNHQNGHYPSMPITNSTNSPGSTGPGHSSLVQGILTK